MAKLKCAACGATFIGDGRRRYCDEHQPARRVRNRSRSQHLHAVGPDEKPAGKKAPKTIEEAAEAGDTLAELRLMRARIARTLDNPNCPPKDISSLSRRQLEIGREIDAMERALRQEEAEDVGRASGEQGWDADAI